MKKNLLMLVLFCLVQFGFKSLASTEVTVSPQPAQLRYSVDFIFQQVLIRKNKTLRADIPLPKLFVASETSLKQFQEAIEPQWGFRPDLITNAYVIKNNEIFLLDEADYYNKTKRCMDDSLAHELTHFVQSKYQGFDLDDDSLEMDAVDVQTWFRENFCPNL